MLVIFIIAVAACEAAIALALVITLFQRRGQLDIAQWQTLREANQPPFQDEPLPQESEEQTESLAAAYPGRHCARCAAGENRLSAQSVNKYEG